MTTIRYAALMLAALTLACIFLTPPSPATVILAGFLLALLGVLRWALHEKETDMTSPLESARRRLSFARTAVINAEEALTAALRRRDDAEQELYRAEEEDQGGAA